MDITGACGAPVDGSIPSGTTKTIIIMHKKFPVLVWKEKDQYVSRCLDPEVASCGDTSEEALAGLQEALELYFEK